MRTLSIAAVLISVILMASCQEEQSTTAAPVTFDIQRGTNISHWLSQSSRRGVERDTYFTRSDVEFIASRGFDHIRIPIDEEQMWDTLGNKEMKAFSLLHNALKWSHEFGLKVIVDLHILRSHHFNRREKPLWTDPAEQERFYDLWRELSDELKAYPLNEVAYELMNEPVADDPEDWNKLVTNCISVVRESEPERKIVVGSNRWQSTETFGDLKLPEDDPHLIVSFHCYTPFLVTHYKASWTRIADYIGPINYPGWSTPQDSVTKLEEPLLTAVADANGYFTKDSLETRILKPVRFANERGLQVYCGEWGSYPTIDQDVRLTWYRDMRAIMEKHQVAWTTWDYKGGFGIRDRETGAPFEDLIAVLVE